MEVSEGEITDFRAKNLEYEIRRFVTQRIVQRHEWVNCGIQARKALAGKITIDLEASVLAFKTRQDTDWIEFPADWWQALKERWFPQWALKRWPAKMRVVPTEVNHFNLCPHVRVPDNKTHMNWTADLHKEADCGS